MDRQGSREMVHVKRLVEERAWHELVPDQDHSVVTKGYGTFGVDDRSAGGDYVAAARTRDGSLVIAYISSTGTDARTLTVDMTKLGGSANAKWFNPTSGVYTTISGSPFANSGSRDFTTPGDNGPGANDWVLLLEASVPDAKPKTYTYKTVDDLPIKADIYRLPGDDIQPVIVWIHIGGLITGSRGGQAFEQSRWRRN